MKRVFLLLLPVSVLAAPAPPAAAPSTPAAAAATPAAAASTPAADPLDALAANSPFLPGTGARGVANAATGPLELRSIVFVDGAYRFSIFDQGTGEANWVAIGDREQPYVARSFDREHDSLTVEHQGRTMVLSLQPARMASSGTAVHPSPSPLPGQGQGDPTNPTNRRNNQGPTPASGIPTGSGPMPNANTPNAAEAQRLQNLADEIRRRRGAGSRINLPQAQPQPQTKRP